MGKWLLLWRCSFGVRDSTPHPPISPVLYPFCFVSSSHIIPASASWTFGPRASGVMLSPWSRTRERRRGEPLSGQEEEVQ